MTINLPNIGAESEKGVVSALDDLFGPSFRELGEYIADKVRYHRAKALNKILDKARLELDGEVLNSPSLKFLVPFLEDASLEDDSEEADSIQDMWANLLIDASRDMRSGHILYRRILKEMTKYEAELINLMVDDHRGTDHDERQSYPASFWYTVNYCDPLSKKELGEFVRYSGMLWKPESICKDVLSVLEAPGRRIAGLALYRTQKSLIDEELHLDYVEYELNSKDVPEAFFWARVYEESVMLLVALGVIERQLVGPVDFDDWSLTVDSYNFTTMGMSFYDACSGEDRFGGNNVRLR